MERKLSKVYAVGSEEDLGAIVPDFKSRTNDDLRILPNGDVLVEMNVDEVELSRLEAALSGGIFDAEGVRSYLRKLYGKAEAKLEPPAPEPIPEDNDE